MVHLYTTCFLHFSLINSPRILYLEHFGALYSQEASAMEGKT